MKKDSLESRAGRVLSPALSHYTSLEVEKGSGVFLISKSGRKYLDFA